MNKLENLLNSKTTAAAKKESLIENNHHLEEKIQKIQKRIDSNSEKIKRLDFFLNKTEETIKVLQTKQS